MQESKEVVEKAPKTRDVIDIDGNQYVVFLDTEMKPAGTNPGQCLDSRETQTVQGTLNHCTGYTLDNK